MRRRLCRKIRERLPLHVGLDLDLRDRTEIDGHLARCLDCYREASAMRTAREELVALRQKRPAMQRGEAFVREVMAQIDGPPPKPQLLPRLVTLGGWVAAALLLGTFLHLRFQEDRGTGRIEGLEPGGPALVTPIHYEPGGSGNSAGAGAGARATDAAWEGSGTEAGKADSGTLDPASGVGESRSEYLQPRKMAYWDL